MPTYTGQLGTINSQLGVSLVLGYGGVHIDTATPTIRPSNIIDLAKVFPIEPLDLIGGFAGTSFSITGAPTTQGFEGGEFAFWSPGFHMDRDRDHYEMRLLGLSGTYIWAPRFIWQLAISGGCDFQTFQADVRTSFECAAVFTLEWLFATLGLAWDCPGVFNLQWITLVWLLSMAGGCVWNKTVNGATSVLWSCPAVFHLSWLTFGGATPTCLEPGNTPASLPPASTSSTIAGGGNFVY